MTATGAANSQVNYTLKCFDSNGETSVEQTRAFSITSPPLPNITSFVATPTSGPPGTTTTLSWSSTNATSCTLQIGSAAPIVVGVSGPRTETPSGSVGTTITYLLQCSGDAGSSPAQASAQFRVVAPPNVSPTVQFNPAGTLNLGGTDSSLNAVATSSFTATGTGASGTGTTTVNCPAPLGGVFTVTPRGATGSNVLGVNNTSVTFDVSCRRATAAQTATLNCTSIPASSGSATIGLTCPAAVNRAPTATPSSLTITGRVGNVLSGTLRVADPDGGTVGVTVGPNPTQGRLSVSAGSVASGNDVIVTFILNSGVERPFTATGTIILTDNATPAASTTVNVNLNIQARDADSSIGGGSAAGTQAIANTLNASTAGVNNPVVAAAVEPTANLCSDTQAASGRLNQLCVGVVGAANGGNADAVSQALLALDTSERAGTGSAAIDAFRQRTSALVGRMTEIRGTGGRGMSIAGLTIQDGYSTLPMSMLLGAAEAALGLDANEQPEDASLASESNWGFFVTGTYARQDKDSSSDGARIGYTLDGYNISTGVDYRFDTSAVVGVALNFADSQTDFDDEDSGLDSSSRSLTVYGTWIGKQGGYVDAAVSFGSLDFEQDRLLDFTSLGLERYRAAGETDGDERAFVLNLGRTWGSLGAFTFTPSIGYSYSKVDIDGFTETGADVFDLRYDDTSVKSSLGQLAIRAERTWNIDERGSMISWHGSLTGYHEFAGDGATIVPTFAHLAGDIPFGVIELDETDTQYYLLDSGFTFVSPRGVQLFFSLGTYMGIEDTSRYYLNVGGRYDF